MVRVAFHHKRLYEIEKLADECCRMCYKPKRIRLCITKDSMGWVFEQCPFNNRKQYWKKTTYTDLIVYYRHVRRFSSVGIKNSRLDRLHTCLVGVAQRFITQLIKLCTPANLHFRTTRQS